MSVLYHGVALHGLLHRGNTDVQVNEIFRRLYGPGDEFLIFHITYPKKEYKK